MSNPQRIQLRRTRGWRLPEGAVVVSRPSKWGNPFVVMAPENGGNIAPERAVELFRTSLMAGRLAITAADVRRDLTGHDLACWCKPGHPCHADVLLEVANRDAR